MARTIALVAAALVVVSTVAHPVSAQTVDSCGGGCPTPPKNFRAVSANLVVLATYPGNSLTATLAKGTKKHVLTADGMLTDPHGFPVSREYDLGVSVNGVLMQPIGIGGPEGEAHEDCGIFRSDPDRVCTVIGHWWLDMDDAANAALIGVPLTITLVGGDPSGGSAVGNEIVDMSLRVRLEKK